MREMRRCTKCLYWHTGETCSAPPAEPEYAVSVLALDLERAEKFAADLRAQLAQRDGELEALREKVARVQSEAQRIYDMGIVSVYESALEIGEIFLSALSDNQKGQDE